MMCKNEGCESTNLKSIASGICNGCYLRERREKAKHAKKTCKTSGCTNKVNNITSGLCSKHYRLENDISPQSHSKLSEDMDYGFITGEIQKEIRGNSVLLRVHIDTLNDLLGYTIGHNTRMLATLVELANEGTLKYWYDSNQGKILIEMDSMLEERFFRSKEIDGGLYGLEETPTTWRLKEREDQDIDYRLEKTGQKYFSVGLNHYYNVHIKDKGE